MKVMYQLSLALVLVSIVVVVVVADDNYNQQHPYPHQPYPNMPTVPPLRRIRLNLGLHVPPIVIKMPRIELPQLSIGAHVVRKPNAKPITVQMPPLPSISFGDGSGGGDGGGGGGGGSGGDGSGYDGDKSYGQGEYSAAATESGNHKKAMKPESHSKKPSSSGPPFFEPAPSSEFIGPLPMSSPINEFNGPHGPPPMGFPFLLPGMNGPGPGPGPGPAPFDLPASMMPDQSMMLDRPPMASAPIPVNHYQNFDLSPPPSPPLPGSANYGPQMGPVPPPPNQSQSMYYQYNQPPNSIHPSRTKSNEYYNTAESNMKNSSPTIPQHQSINHPVMFDDKPNVPMINNEMYGYYNQYQPPKPSRTQSSVRNQRPNNW